MGAPLAPVANVLKMFLKGFVDGNDIYKWGNILHFLYTGTAPTAAELATLAGAVASQWSTHMAPECPAPTTLTEVQITDLTGPSMAEATTVGSFPGSRGDDSIPANAAVLIQYPSLTRYRGGHPRSYLYCLGNADLDGAALWSSAATAEVQAHWQAFLNGILSETWSGGSLSEFGFVRYHGKYLPNGGPPHYYLDSPFFTAVPVSSAAAMQEMASQRRRVGRRKA